MAFNTVPVNGWPQLKNLGEGGGDVSALTARVSALEETVGDSEEGLVADVSALEETVGNNESGLVKDVADLQNANKYLTTETLVGKWGTANLYRKYFVIPALPNTTTGSYSTGLTTETVKRVEFYYDNDDEVGTIWNQLTSVSYNKSTKKIDIGTSTDMSDYTGVVIVEYTK